MSKSFSVLLVSVLLMGCAKEHLINVDTTQYQLFKKVPAEESGIDFANTISENMIFNVSLYDNLMTGGGVGLLDVNNDGLLDIFFAGNQVQDRLYLNKGHLRFEDITLKAGLRKNLTWTAGVLIADVNGDGWDDIYLCKYVFDDPAQRVNQYFENQHDGTFRERAQELGIADAGYSTTGTFFDFDADGDLDLYVGNQPPTSIYQRPKYQGVRDFQFTDRLYRNDRTKFVDITEQAGIRNFCYTLSVNATDMNGDHLPDLYVAADYEEPDLVYINQGNGTFVNIADKALRHMCNSAMGTDIADINNDGLLDIYTLDMVAPDNYRSKTNLGGMQADKFWVLAENGYHFQYMFNALQLNNGNGTYSEIGQLASVAHTDWSWATFFLDADHDGWMDLFVTNGQVKDVRNLDYDAWRRKYINDHKDSVDIHTLFYEISQKAPSKKVVNYLFRNKGDLTFDNLAQQWGLTDETWSQGAAYGDLDNDGDLDIVINNTDDKALVYASQVNDLRINHYLTVRVAGPANNTRGFNAGVTVLADGVKHVGEINPNRGYLSSSEPVFQVGLGSSAMAQEVKVTWPDGYVLTKKNVRADRTVVMNYDEASPGTPVPPQPPTMFSEVKGSSQITYHESTYDDYAREPLLPYRLSTLGPAMATGDVNGDHLDDIYLGGAAGHAGTIYLQQDNGMFTPLTTPVFERDAVYEDGGATFFDMDHDGDLDLYVCSGSNEFPVSSPLYQDRLYVNDGNGGFTKSAALPKITASTSVAVPLDYDNDGDMDIFVGARQVPGAYGRTPESLLLMNLNGEYEDIGGSALPDDGYLGMVTDARWVTLPGTLPQLVVVGEWMRIRILQWSEDHFEEKMISGLEKSEGMWNTVLPYDIDKDGDIDLIVGNCGLNMKYQATPDEPFKLYVNDFDGNGTDDLYLGYYDVNDGKYYPVADMDNSIKEMPFLATKYQSYAAFASATIDDILQGKMQGGEEHVAHIFANGIFENIGAELLFRPFRNEAQMSPMYGIVVSDFNGDGLPDIFMAGNFYNREALTTRSDAGEGTLLLGTGDLNLHFQYVNPSRTGILADQDVRAVALVKQKGTPLLVIANNGTPVQFYRPNPGAKTGTVQ